MNAPKVVLSESTIAFFKMSCGCEIVSITCANSKAIAKSKMQEKQGKILNDIFSISVGMRCAHKNPRDKLMNNCVMSQIDCINKDS